MQSLVSHGIWTKRYSYVYLISWRTYKMTMRVAWEKKNCMTEELISASQKCELSLFIITFQQRHHIVDWELMQGLAFPIAIFLIEGCRSLKEKRKRYKWWSWNRPFENFTDQITSRLIVKKYLIHKWWWVCWNDRNHNLVLILSKYYVPN